MKTMRRGVTVLVAAIVTGATVSHGKSASQTTPRALPFQIEEATIDDIHAGIKIGAVTCSGVVQAYLERAKAYNGVCTQLVTRDGTPIPPARGYVRAGSPIEFPTTTTPVASVLPEYERYAGVPIEFGRMEPTASDPTVVQQFGSIVQMPGAARLNALETFNLRGERSVTCKAGCDTHPSQGALPSECPAACEAFRQQPDALERAAQLDREFGSKPDLTRLPMYCIPFAFKDPWDTKDMRSTSNADVNYAMDAAPRDSTVAAELRARGAIIYAKANAFEYHAGSGDPGGEAAPRTRIIQAIPSLALRSTWSGQSCNAYDTERWSAGSSSGSAVAVAANLVTCAVCETTGGSCRGPAAYNGVVNLVTTKGLISFGGASGANPWLDRAGIMCRTVGEAAQVLDALKDPERGYFDPRDIYTALPKPLISSQPHVASVRAGRTAQMKPLAGMRIGIVREYMVKHVPNDAAISSQIDREIKDVLRDRLGAEIVESVDSQYPDDPSVPNMAYTFNHALAEILPFHIPEYLAKKTRDGRLEFAVDGHDVTSLEYMVKVSRGKAPWPDSLNLRRLVSFPPAHTFRFALNQYLLDRDDARVKDFESLNAQAKYYSDARRAAMENWQHKEDIGAEGMSERMQMREVFRLVVLKVMHQNQIDLFVNPSFTIPQQKVHGPVEPTVSGRPGLPGSGQTPVLGVPEINVPAGFNRVEYAPRFVLSADGKSYSEVTGKVQTRLPHPMPISIAFWAGPGDEPTLLKVASAYEAATKHRAPPPAFGPVSRASVGRR